MSKSWKLNQQATLRKLKEYFDGVLLLDLTPSMAQAFRDDLAEKQAQATVSGHIKRIKKALALAVKRGLIHSSAFSEVIAGKQTNENRKHFVSREVIGIVIDACPNADWRLLVALARFGGLRNSSETMALEWKDVDFHLRTTNELVLGENYKQYTDYRKKLDEIDILLQDENFSAKENY